MVEIPNRGRAETDIRGAEVIPYLWQKSVAAIILGIVIVLAVFLLFNALLIPHQPSINLTNITVYNTTNVNTCCCDDGVKELPQPANKTVVYFDDWDDLEPVPLPERDWFPTPGPTPSSQPTPTEVCEFPWWCK